MHHHNPDPSSSSSSSATTKTRKRKRVDGSHSERSPKRLAHESDDDEIAQVEFGSTSESLSTPLSPSPFPDFETIPSTTVSASSSFSTHYKHHTPTPTPTPAPAPAPPPRDPEVLAEYTCPICFTPPTNATIAPCGHICCGACLFTAVKTTLHRGAMTYSREPNVARFVRFLCPFLMCWLSCVADARCAARLFLGGTAEEAELLGFGPEF